MGQARRRRRRERAAKSRQFDHARQVNRAAWTAGKARKAVKGRRARWLQALGHDGLARKVAEVEALDRRAVEEYLAANGVTKCPTGYARGAQPTAQRVFCRGSLSNEED